MKSIQALREQRNALAKDAKNQLANKGDQKWTAEDKATFDALADQIDAIDDQIATTQKILDRVAEERFDDAVAGAPASVSGPNATAKAVHRALFDKLLRNGPTALTPAEHTQIRNTLSTGTGNQGGYTVQTDVAMELIEAIAGYRGIRDRASRIVTSTGNPLGYPTSDGTSEEGEIVAENVAAGAADPTFGTVPLNTFKFGSKVITVPIELLQDSNVDIIALVNKRVRDRIGRIQNKKFTIGSGSGEPYGLTVAASVGKTGTTGQTTSVIYDDLVDLQESIDYAYDEGGNLGWMMSQAIRKVIRKIKDTAGRPIWTPSYDAGIAGAKADQLLGADIQLNNHMPTPAANAVSIAFGDLSRYMVRDALEVTLFRFEDSAYLSKGQIGFLAWARSGGNLLDTGAVKTYKHSAT
jgi:HK97 family phage major capsid protein